MFKEHLPEILGISEYFLALGSLMLLTTKILFALVKTAMPVS